MAAYHAFTTADFAGPRLRAWLRRAAPVTLALTLHAVALALLINLVRPPVTEPPLRPIQVALVRPAPEPEAVEPPARPVTAAAEPSRAEPVVPQQAEAGPAQTSPQPAAPSPASELQDTREPAVQGAVLDAPGGATVQTALPTRSSALRGLACARAFAGEDETLGCEGEAGAGYDFARFAAGEGAAQVEGLVAARFNAIAGLYGAQLDPSLRRLPGQQGMQVMATRRMGMSGADEMRETLPALVPDPAFGD